MQTMSSTSASPSTAPAGPGPGSTSNRPVLGPAWYRGGGGHGNRGFQPPPAVSSEREQEERRGSSDLEGKNMNSYAALLHFDNTSDDEQGQTFVNVGSNKQHHPEEESSSMEKKRFSSRSEALLGSSGRGGAFSRPSSGGASFQGIKTTGRGRSLAELASASSKPTGRQRGTERPHDDGVEKKTVIRYTRERLLSLRKPTDPNAENIPPFLKHLEGTVILASRPQDPVCYEEFDPDEIWSQPSRPNRSTPNAQKTSSLRSLSERNESSGEVKQNGGRWQRGVALPPPSSREKARMDDDATSPEDLWDDPVTTSASMDLSQYGSIPGETNRSRQNSVGSNSDKEPLTGSIYDWKDISDATSRFDKEFHVTVNKSVSTEDDETDVPLSTPVDPHKPLATVGTIIRSGTEDVNVFEDFDVPSEPSPPEKKDSEEKSTEKEDISASSRLMQMIGMSVPDEATGSSKLMTTWGGGNIKDDPGSATPSLTNVTGGFIGSTSSSVPKNPWGTSLGLSAEPTPVTSSMSNSEGLDLSSRLEAAVVEQKAREVTAAAEAAAEEQRIQEQQRQQQLLRRQKEEDDEAQRIQALLRAQIEAQHAAAQQARQAAEAQRQAAAAQAAAAAGRVQYNSEVEAILLERISTVLENSWGRSDLMTILSTLHLEDSRVVPLLGSIDALKALLSRHPQRIALAKDTAYGVDVAILIVSNAEWHQRKIQQEELQRQQQHIHAVQAAAQAQAEAKAAQEQAAAIAAQSTVKITNSPWFYADPQGNIQGPFGGEEMRQWLDAGYFKGDLPVSQNPKGPFRSLFSIFPNPSFAFNPTNNKNNFPIKISASKEDVKLEKQLEGEGKSFEKNSPKNESIPDLKSTTAPTLSPRMSDQNASSVQLKLLLGLGGSNNNSSSNEAKIDTSSGSGIVIAGPPPAKDCTSPKQKEFLETSSQDSILNHQPQQKTSSKQKQQTSNKQRLELESSILSLTQESSLAPSPAPTAPTTAPTPTLTAWGGAAANKASRRKSMSEIQQEETRVAAMIAKERQTVTRSSSVGWANVAASGGGSTGWSSGAIKQPNPVVVLSSSPQAKVVVKQQPQVQKPTLQQQQQRNNTNTRTSKPVDDFGASGRLSPELESWCKEEMRKLTGSDDLTLISFCMTLSDENEIRQYLTAYLGNTQQVNSFANDFINRKGGNKKNSEEWESADRAKKGRKKKSSLTSK